MLTDFHPSNPYSKPSPKSPESPNASYPELRFTSNIWFERDCKGEDPSIPHVEFADNLREMYLTVEYSPTIAYNTIIKNWFASS